MEQLGISLEEQHMNIVADTHCHTIASSHAYSTVLEMVHAARDKGLCAIAITDHGIGMPDSPHYWHFGNMRSLPETIDGVRLITGTEANIMDFDGNLDFTGDQLRRMQWVIVSFHDTVIEPGIREEHTNAVLNVLKNPYVDVLGHMGTPCFAFDYELVISKCNEYHKIMEINASSYAVRKGSQENCRVIAILCKKYRVPIVINSDAHFSLKVGDVEVPLEMLKEIDFPEELVVNADKDRFFEVFNQHQEYKKKK